MAKWVWAGAVVLVVGLVGVAGALSLDPGFLPWLMPGWLDGPLARGRVQQVFGALLLGVPFVAVLVSLRRGSRRAAGWYLALALLAVLPALVFFDRGAYHVRQSEPGDEPACVERSGGPATCPGG